MENFWGYFGAAVLFAGWGVGFSRVAHGLSKRFDVFLNCVFGIWCAAMLTVAIKIWAASGFWLALLYVLAAMAVPRYFMGKLDELKHGILGARSTREKHYGIWDELER